MPTKTENQEQTAERNLAVRPKLPAEYMEQREQARQEAANRVFFSFAAEDTCIVQLVKREVIPTQVGDSACWTALYLQGNIHGTGGGSPSDIDQGFRFWETTVLAKQLKEIDARPGDTIYIDCLGERQGKKFSYMDFAVKIVNRSPTAGGEDGWQDPSEYEATQKLLEDD